VRTQDSQRRQCKHRELSLLPLFPRRFTFALIGKTPEPRWGRDPFSTYDKAWCNANLICLLRVVWCEVSVEASVEVGVDVCGEAEAPNRNAF
jgi:hypothetical protein